MGEALPISSSFVREHLREPLMLALLVVIPIFFVLIFASVLGDFAKALGGTIARQSATSISAGWAAAFLSGTLGFFQLSSSRSADRRLSAAGLGPWRVAVGRIAAALVLGLIISTCAFFTLWLRSGIGHPLHAFVAIFSFAVIYIGIGAVIGSLVTGMLEGSLLVLLFFSVDAFSSPEMTSRGAFAWTPTRDAASLLIAAGSDFGSPRADWFGMAVVAVAALSVAATAFWFSARTRI